MSSFGDLLRLYRQRSNDPSAPGRRLSQERLGELLGKELGLFGSYSGSAVSDWEREQSTIHSDDRRLLIALLKVLFSCGGIRNLREANDLLEAGNYRALRSDERDYLFKDLPSNSLSGTTEISQFDAIFNSKIFESESDQPRTFAGFATNDRLEGQDQLGYDDFAIAIARVLSNEDTKTPITIGIYGPWGVGKSFLMKRILTKLKEIQKSNKQLYTNQPTLRKIKKWFRQLWHINRTPSKEVNFHFVEFNAWIYSGSENLWAGLITHLYDEVETHLGTFRTARFRLGQTFQNAAKKTFGLLAIYGLLGFGISILFDFNDIENKVNTFGITIGTLILSVIGGTALAALPPFIHSIRELASSIVLTRSQQLAILSSRRDFRDKIGFMADIKAEIRVIRRLLDAGKNGIRTRLVIFIDDLDRCSPIKAVEVLEAIMLLLADEDGMPFIVLLGLDARIIVKAIEERYGKILTEAGITGYEYLDKIVQIPFCIPPPSPQALRTYATSLLWRSEEEENLAKKNMQKQTSQMPIKEKSNQSPESSAQSLPIPNEISFTPEEYAALDACAQSKYLSTNPRRIKRIINIYRVARLLAKNIDNDQCQHLIKWVILSEQWPYRVGWLLQYIKFTEFSKRTYEKDTPLLNIFMEIIKKVESFNSYPLSFLDEAEQLFEKYLSVEPILTIDDILWIRPFMFNLNPSLLDEIARSFQQKYEKASKQK